MTRVLPKLLAVLTKHPRYIPDVEWSSNSWTHNVFRTYELIFGRRYGIKAEMSYSNGVYVCHSWEAVFALTETYVREFFSSFKFVPFKIYVPVLMTPQGLPVFSSPYLFAIATDNTSSQVTGSTTSFSFTATGSNLKLISAGLGDVTGTDNMTAETYNSVALTKKQSLQIPSDRIQNLWSLDGPSTGANTFAVTSTGFCNIALSTYTGCASGFDSSNSGTASAAVTLTVSTTVVASNCWLVGVMGNSSGTQTAGANTTLRVASGSGNTSNITDSNATVGTGSQSQTVNKSGSQNWSGIVVSIAPSGGVVAAASKLTLIGVT